MKAKAIPQGMHSVTPHLVCAGAANAIEFYKKAFGAVEKGRMPAPDGRLMHAAIGIGDSTVMLVDEMPEWGARGESRREGDDAGRRHVLGRSLRQDRGSVRPPLVGRHAPARRQPRRDAE